MTTQTLRVPRPSQGWRERAGRAARGFLAGAARVTGSARRHARPATNHLREHGYTLAAAASFSIAGFTHSVFTGFIVMGVAFLAIEFKVRD